MIFLFLLAPLSLSSCVCVCIRFAQRALLGTLRGIRFRLSPTSFFPPVYVCRIRVYMSQAIVGVTNTAFNMNEMLVNYVHVVFHLSSSSFASVLHSTISGHAKIQKLCCAFKAWIIATCKQIDMKNCAHRTVSMVIARERRSFR